MKKLVAILLAAVLMLSLMLTACSQTPATTTGADVTEAPGTTSQGGDVGDDPTEASKLYIKIFTNALASYTQRR